MFEDKKRSAFFKTIMAAVFTTLGVVILLYVFSSGYITRNITDQKSPQDQSLPQEQERRDVVQPQQISVEMPDAPTPAASVAKSASSGVVGISVLRVDGNEIFRNDSAEKWGVGSGVVVSPDGYILTNHHVAGGESERIVVSFADGSNLDGVTLWSDPILDLAVVKVDGSDLATIPLGDATNLQVGELAIAIGNPLGLQFQRTVTSGIISALNRTIEIETEHGRNFMEDLIQTDASINPGNSGGPLLNSNGQVVGINTIKVTGAEAIGFAIPINVAVPIIESFVRDGRFDEPYLGVFAYDKEVIPYLDGSLKIDHGIYVANVDEEGPAFKNGIKLGCIIKQVDGIDMNTMMQLRTYMYSKKPGDVINVTHLMKGTNKDVTVPITLSDKTRDDLITR